MPLLDDFLAIVCIGLLSLPATAALFFAMVLFAIGNAPIVLLCVGLLCGLAGLGVVELTVFALRRLQYQGRIILWTRTEWVRYIRVAEAAGIVCAILIRFVMR